MVVGTPDMDDIIETTGGGVGGFHTRSPTPDLENIELHHCFSWNTVSLPILMLKTKPQCDGIKRWSGNEGTVLMKGQALVRGVEGQRLSPLDFLQFAVPGQSNKVPT